MSDGADQESIFWVDPQRRGIIPIDGLHISRSLARRIRKGGFEVRVNTDFAATVDGCADRTETWINSEIFATYIALHAQGFAHSVEIWRDDQMIGGIFGVALGSAFFGESMFSRAPDGSKLALTYLVSRLRAGRFTLFDTQFTTDHLIRMGGREMPRAAYREALQEALRRPADFFEQPFDVTPAAVLLPEA